MPQTDITKVMKQKMLSPAQHTTLKARLKKAFQAYKKVEGELKLSSKKLDAADKALKKAEKDVKVKKTPVARNAKKRAAENLKKAKAKLALVEKKAVDKECDFIDAEYKLDAAKRKQAAWERDLVAFEKSWERQFGKKPAKKVVSKKAASKKAPAKKAAVKKPVVAKKPSPVVVKTEPKLEEKAKSFFQGAFGHDKPEEKVYESHLSETKPVEEHAQEEKPFNPFPFPRGFGFKDDDNTH